MTVDPFHSGYFDPFRHTMISGSWSPVFAIPPVSESFIPAPGAVVDEPEGYHLVPSYSSGMEVHTVVVVHPSNQVDLVESFLSEESANKLANLLRSYAAENMTITVQKTSVQS
jgi:hypothetical protein